MVILKHKIQRGIGFTVEMAIYFSYRIDSILSFSIFNFYKKPVGIKLSNYDFWKFSMLLYEYIPTF